MTTNRMHGGRSIQMKQALSDIGMQGSIMLATEGINVSLAGSVLQGTAVRNWFDEDSRFADLWLKESASSEVPYRRLRVRVRTEIIAFDGQDSEVLQAQRPKAPPIAPETLSQWLDESRDITLLDTRNDYEIVSGTFPASVHLDIKHFRNFKAAVAKALEAGTLDPDKPMVTYCTGGIRCEKAAPWLLENGFKEVYQIEGGLLNYLETCGTRHWQGDCFVFDQRVSVKHGLVPGDYDLCHACRMPISEEEKRSEHYTSGISCPHCIDKVDPEKRKRFADRQKQIDLAKARDETHLAVDLPAVKARKRAEREAQRASSRKGDSAQN